MKGKAIWKKYVAEKAVAVARANGNSTCQGSDGYIANFMQRNQLSLRSKTQAARKITFTDKDKVNLA